VCPDSPYAVLVGVLLLLIAVAGLGFWLNKHQVNIAVMAIGVDYIQVIAILASARIKWDPALVRLFQILSAFNLNIEIVAPECLVPDVSFVTKWMIIVCLPLLVGALFVAQFGVLYAVKRFVRGHTRRAKLCSHYPALVSSLLILMYILFIYLCKNIFDIFNCAPTTPSDGKLYLTAVFEECTTPISGVQAKLFAPALLALFIYMFGYPAFVASALWRQRELVAEDQLLRARGTGGDALTNPNAFHLRRTLGRSYYQFKPDFFLWVLAILMRKVAIAATSVIFNRNPSFQMAACLLIMFLAFSAQVQMRPYMSPSEHEDVAAAWKARGLVEPKSVFGRLNTRLAHVAAMGRKGGKKVDLSMLTAGGRVNAHAAWQLLKQWMLNYNTVEAFMLFSAVLVCLLCLLYIVRASARLVIAPLPPPF
jgi:hypothetical protein